MQGVSSVEGTPFLPCKNFERKPMKKLLTMLLCLAMAFTCAFGVAACTPTADKDDTDIVTPGGDDQTPGGSEQPDGEETPEPELNPNLPMD